MANKETLFSKDPENNQLHVVRAFDAPLPQVWQAWTNAETLDKWWAPKPYRAQTKSMNFTEGGAWLYGMVGPEGDVQWCKESFSSIIPQKSISNDVVFCDEAGKVNSDFPAMYWEKEFSETAAGTKVDITITYDKAADMETILEMGFKEGFTAGLENLDEVLTGK